MAATVIPCLPADARKALAALDKLTPRELALVRKLLEMLANAQRPT